MNLTFKPYNKYYIFSMVLINQIKILQTKNQSTYLIIPNVVLYVTPVEQTKMYLVMHGYLISSYFS